MGFGIGAVERCLRTIYLLRGQRYSAGGESLFGTDEGAWLPLSYNASAITRSYQGLYENGFVLWINERFFALNLDRQHWESFPDPFPTNDKRYFERKTLRQYFPQCGDRLPIAGLAKQMLGPQKQFYAWLGCLQAENSASLTSGVVAQQFSRGWVIEGVLNPPQSTYRNRIVLIDGDGWKSEPMDATGKFNEITPQ